MSPGLAWGMLWAGILLSAIPIVVFLAGGVYMVRRYLEEKAGAPDGAAGGDPTGRS